MKIDKGVDFPNLPFPQEERVQVFNKMERGDSIFFADRYDARKFKGTIDRHIGYHQLKCRSDGAGMRVWRVSDVKS